MSTQDWETEGLARAHRQGLDVRMVHTAHQCAVCMRHTADPMFALQERQDQAASQSEDQSWLLCRGCATAVLEEVERAALRTPHRLRIAVGVVASERSPRNSTPECDDEFWEHGEEPVGSSMIVGYVLVCIIIPPLVFLLVLALSSAAGGGP